MKQVLWFLAMSTVVARAAATQDDSHARALFITRCSQCHQPDGRGLAGIAPPLRDRIRNYAMQPGGWRYLSRVITFGLTGRIDVDGATYDGAMPSFSTLTTDERATILNYVANLGESGPVPTQLLPSQIEIFTRDVTDPESLLRERSTLPVSSAAPPLPQQTSARPQGIGRPAGILREPQVDYARNCQGCHLATGEGIVNAVPPLRGHVGYFLRTPEGRAYVPRVPGVAYSPLSNSDLAVLLNWMLQQYSAAELPADFVPYTIEEVASFRARPLTDARLERALALRGMAEVDSQALTALPTFLPTTNAAREH